MLGNTILFIVANRLYIYNECCLRRSWIIRFIHSFVQPFDVCLRASLCPLNVRSRPWMRAFLHSPLRLDLCHTQCNMHQFVVTTDANMYNSGNGVLRYRWVHDGVRLIFRTTCSLFSRLQTATKKSLEKHRNDTHHYYKAIFSPFMHTNTHKTKTRAYSHRIRTAQRKHPIDAATDWGFSLFLAEFFFCVSSAIRFRCDYIKNLPRIGWQWSRAMLFGQRDKVVIFFGA